MGRIVTRECGLPIGRPLSRSIDELAKSFALQKGHLHFATSTLGFTSKTGISRTIKPKPAGQACIRLHTVFGRCMIEDHCASDNQLEAAVSSWHHTADLVRTEH